MTPTAAGVLAAADAVAHQEAFTRDQAAYLMHLAYDSGRTATYREDLAELHSVWEDHAERRRTYEQKVADRIAEMEQHATRFALEMVEQHGRVPWTYTGGPVDWETGRPQGATT